MRRLGPVNAAGRPDAAPVTRRDTDRGSAGITVLAVRLF